MEEINYNSEDLLDHDVVAAIIKNKKGEILMQEHLKYGFWTVPVGKVKPGQTISEGLKAEMKEECNIKVEDFKELTKKNYVYERKGKDVKIVGHIIEILNYNGEMKNNEPEKHREQRFILLDKIKKLPYLSDLTVLYLELIGFKRNARI
jgi:ADP-ribose pyrophosphatase YjhB (NUDIX family)